MSSPKHCNIYAVRLLLQVPAILLCLCALVATVSAQTGGGTIATADTTASLRKFSLNCRKLVRSRNRMWVFHVHLLNNPTPNAVLRSVGNPAGKHDVNNHEGESFCAVLFCCFACTSVVSEGVETLCSQQRYRFNLVTLLLQAAAPVATGELPIETLSKALGNPANIGTGKNLAAISNYYTKLAINDNNLIRSRGYLFTEGVIALSTAVSPSPCCT